VFGGYSSETVSEEARNDFISAGYGVVDSDYSGDGWTMETGEAGFSGWGFAINPTLGLVGNQSCQVN
jgi:hypothetical protein